MMKNFRKIKNKMYIKLTTGLVRTFFFTLPKSPKVP